MAESKRSTIGRKRRRNWSIRKSLVATVAVLPCVYAEPFFGACFTYLQESDVDSNQQLSRSEFTTFVTNISGRSIDVADIPSSISGPYLRREDEALESMDISGVYEENELSSENENFCRGIYNGLAIENGIAIEDSDCIDALQFADTKPENGRLTPDEYPDFLSSLTGVSLESDLPIEDLPLAAQQCFNDISIDGSIRGQRGANYLNMFCQRAAVAMVTPDPGDSGTAAPSSVVQGTNSTTSPTRVEPTTPSPTPIGNNNTATSSPPTGTEPTTPSPTPIGNNNTATSSPPTGTEPTTPSPTPIGNNNTATSSPPTGTEPTTPSPTLVGNSNNSTSSPPTGTEPPTPLPTPVGNNNTATSSPPTGTEPTTPSPTPVGNTNSPTSSPPTTPVPTSPPLSTAQFNGCRTNLIVSDLNRNDRLEKSEYVRFIERMTSGTVSTNPDSFDDLDLIFRDNYYTISSPYDDDMPHLDGSKPGKTPTQEQQANLMSLCRQTYDTIQVYETRGPTDDPYELSEQEFTACVNAMVLSDVSRDEVLQKSEYARFVQRLAPDSLSSLGWSSFSALDPLLQSLYDTEATSAGLPIAGSRPGSQAMPSMINELRKVCVQVNQTFESLETNGPSTRPPVSSTPAPTLAPFNDGLDDAFFEKCTQGMLISDRDRDDKLDPDEFVRLLNRLTFSEFAGQSFEQLHADFRLSFYREADNDQIDIYGSKPGQNPDRSEIEQLRQVCRSVKSALDNYQPTEPPMATPPSPFPPPTTPEATVLATSPPTMRPTRYIGGDTCPVEALSADANGDLLMNGDEYLAFVNGLIEADGRDATISYFFFAELPVEFRNIFNDVAVDEAFIDLVGDDSAVPILCSRVARAVDSILVPNCKPYLVFADSDAGATLTEEEYLTFVSNFTDTQYVSLDNLPFVLRDNFDWLNLNNDNIDVAGADLDTTETGDNLRLNWICDRVNTLLQGVRSGDKGLTLEDHCSFAVDIADANDDGYLDQPEYVDLIREFSALKWRGVNFSQVVRAYRSIFDKYDLGIGRVNTAQSLSNGICDDLRAATMQSRDSEIFFEFCRTSLQLSDDNVDNRLQREEYVSFMYNLAVSYGYESAQPEGIKFEELSSAAKLNFAALDVLDKGIDILGTHLPPSSSEAANLREICRNVEPVIGNLGSKPATDDPTFVTVYNSFIISNLQGYLAAELKQGDERLGLDRAYAIFVEEQVKNLKDRKRRLRRSLAPSGLKENSVAVYHILDSPCTHSTLPDTNCQTVYALFDIFLENEFDPASASQRYSNQVQDAIDDGQLQISLSVADPDSPFQIVESSLPLQPNPITPMPATEAANQEKGFFDGMVIPLAVGAVVGLAMFGFLYWYRYMRKGKKTDEGKEESSENSNRKGGRPSDGATDDDSMFSKKRREENVEIEHDLSDAGFSVDSEDFHSGELSEMGLARQSRPKESFLSDGRDQSERSDDQLYFRGEPSAHKHVSEPQSASEEYKDDFSIGDFKNTSDSEESTGNESPWEEEGAREWNESTKSWGKSGDPWEHSPRQALNDRHDPDDEPSASGTENSNDHLSEGKGRYDDEVSDSHDTYSAPEKEFGDSGRDGNGDYGASYDHEYAQETEDQETNLEEGTSEEGDYDLSSDGTGHNSEFDDGQSVGYDSESDDFTMADTIAQSIKSEHEVKRENEELQQALRLYRPQVEALVRFVVPEELDNVDDMIEQFLGREQELIDTLNNMAKCDDSSNSEDDGSYYTQDEDDEIDHGDDDRVLYEEEDEDMEDYEETEDEYEEEEIQSHDGETVYEYEEEEIQSHDGESDYEIEYVTDEDTSY